MKYEISEKQPLRTGDKMHAIIWTQENKIIFNSEKEVGICVDELGSFIFRHLFRLKNHKLRAIIRNKRSREVIFRWEGDVEKGMNRIIEFYIMVWQPDFDGISKYFVWGKKE